MPAEAQLPRLPRAGTPPKGIRLSATYGADRLLELGADLSENLEAYGQGLVGESAVRTAALAVAAESASVWLATCGLPLEAATGG